MGRAVTNSLVANASTTSSVVFGNSSGNLNGALTGTGTVNVSTSGTTAIAPALPNFSSFNGTVGIDLGPSLTNTFNPQINSNGAGAKFVVTGTGGFVYSGLSGNSTISLGELSGDGRIAGIFDAGFSTTTTTWSIGALNTSSTFSGGIIDNHFAADVTAVTKGLAQAP